MPTLVKILYGPKSKLDQLPNCSADILILDFWAPEL